MKNQEESKPSGFRSIGERSLQKKVWLAMLRSMAPEVRVWSIGASRSMAV